MRYLRPISYGITIAGIVLVVAAIALDLSPTVALIGMMLVVAGLVKIATVAIWHGTFGFGVPLTHHDETREAAIEEGRR